MSEHSLVTRIEVVGAEEAKRTLMDYFRLYQEGEKDVKELNKAMREQYGAIYGQRRALSLMRTEWRMQHAAWVEGARVMRDLGRIGRTITSMWQAYNIGMIRIESAQRDVRDATLKVSDAQERYNRYLEIFGEDSVYTIDAYNDLQGAIKSEKEAMDQAKKAQDDMTIGMIGMGLSSISAGADIIKMVGDLKSFKDTLVMVKKTASGLSGTLGTLATLGEIGIVIGITLAIKEGWESLMDFLFGKEQRETWGRLKTPRELWGLPPAQFGIPYVPETRPYLLHRGEEVVAAPMARMRGRGGGVIVRQVRINQYIGNVSSDVDVSRMADDAYRKLMRKLEAVG